MATRHFAAVRPLLALVLATSACATGTHAAPASVSTSSSSADGSPAHFEVVPDGPGTLPAQPGLEIFRERGGSWLAGWGGLLYRWTDGPMPMPAAIWSGPAAAAPFPSCEGAGVPQDVAATFPVLTTQGACAYRVVYPLSEPSYVVEHGFVRLFDAPRDEKDAPPHSVAQLGDALVFATDTQLYVFSASTRRYRGSIAVDSTKVLAGPGHLIVVLHDRAVRLRLAPRDPGPDDAFPEIASIKIDDKPSGEEPEVIAPLALVDGRLDTEARVAGAAWVTIELAYPALISRVCLSARAGSDAGVLSARAFAPFREKQHPIVLEGAPPPPPTGQPSADDAAKPLPVLTQSVVVNLRCDQASAGPDMLCPVAEIDVGCRHPSTPPR